MCVRNDCDLFKDSSQVSNNTDLQKMCTHTHTNTQSSHTESQRCAHVQGKHEINERQKKRSMRQIILFHLREREREREGMCRIDGGRMAPLSWDACKACLGVNLVHGIMLRRYNTRMRAHATTADRNVCVCVSECGYVWLCGCVSVCGASYFSI